MKDINPARWGGVDVVYGFIFVMFCISDCKWSHNFVSHNFVWFLFAHIKKKSYLCSGFWKNGIIMTIQEPKQMPIITGGEGMEMPPQQYFTADEAMAFMEPRIRAMFR